MEMDSTSVDGIPDAIEIGVVAREAAKEASYIRTRGPSTKRQREYMDYLAEGMWIGYQGLLRMCGRVAGRRIRDIGELTMGEAGKVLDGLRGMKPRVGGLRGRR